MKCMLDGENRQVGRWLAPSAVASLLVLAGCSGDDGKNGAPGVSPAAPTPDVLEPEDDAPGVNVQVLGLAGASGAGGNFMPGDRLAVTFTVKKDDGSDWNLSELDRGRILCSGPTFNYQRVLAEESDLLTAATANADGSHTYTFAAAFPATYLPPLNDTASFGALDGELSGQALLAGTYTLGIYIGWDFTVNGEAFRDQGDSTFDFLLGSGAVLASREVIKRDNCNQCHTELQAHGGLRRATTLCLLCHTAGAEDRNDASAAGGTPGASIEFAVMVHKIHNGEHLPSVLGVGVNPDGSRNYAATPLPYQLVGFNNSIHDYSDVGFPIMPSAYVSYLYDKTGTTYLGVGGNGPTPRDSGYAALGLSAKLLEDRVRTGAVSCETCHGDPDGTGPLTAPAQGSLAFSQPARATCGSCHDDIDWGLPYESNTMTMPAQTDDTACTLCHSVSGDELAVQDAHLHPYRNPLLNTGVNVDVAGVGGGSGVGGRHQAGDPIEVTFSVRDDAGADLPLNPILRFQAIVSGPTTNQQWVLPNLTLVDNTFRKSGAFTGSGSISAPSVGAGAIRQTIAVLFTGATTFDLLGSVSAPLTGQPIGAGSGSTAAVSYAGVGFTITQGSTAFADGDRWTFEVWPVDAQYTMRIPRDITFERLGVATGGADTFPVANTPVYWGRQTVVELTSFVGAASATTEPAELMGRYVAVEAAQLPGVAVNDKVVIDAGTSIEEFLTVGRIQTTDDSTGLDLGILDRLWFSQPLRYDHSMGASVQEVTLTTKREDLDYTLASSGATSIALVAGRFAAGNPVLISYRTDGRFGWYPGPGEPLQAIYPPAAADTDDIDATWGDWRALAIQDGTYAVGMWANRDFTVTPAGLLTTTGSWNDLNTDNTTYRMITPPATYEFLYGAATAIESRTVIASGASCNACHGDIQAHGNGRRGLSTCLMCHSTSGLEDAAPYSFDGWYVPKTPGVTMDFRTLLHKVHMGKELANASTYVADGVFLGTAYPVSFEEIGFPSMPGEVSNCAACHGDGNDAWQAPTARVFNGNAVPVRDWRAACGACHDSSSATAHIDVQTALSGAESCDVCHGEGKTWSVELAHKVR